MITYKEVTMEVQKVDTIICDCCKKNMLSDDVGGFVEAQERLSWENRGGYGSIFGDGEEMSLDLCQHCIKKLLGEYIQFKGNAYWGDLGESND